MSIVTHHTALPDSSQKTDFYSLVDNATTTGIVDSDIASNAAIADTKLATITTAGKVDGSAMNNLANIPSGSGRIPGVNGGVPTGFIGMWSGTIATIPTGWLLCDGTNSTPDLRDKFVIGAKQDSGGIAKTNVTGSLTQTGGSATKTITGTTDAGNNTTSSLTSGNTASRADHTHTFTVSGQDVLNPYYALAFIMKS